MKLVCFCSSDGFWCRAECRIAASPQDLRYGQICEQTRMSMAIFVLPLFRPKEVVMFFTRARERIVDAARVGSVKHLSNAELPSM